MKTDLDSIFGFMALVHRFQAVERTCFVPKLERKENDAEHSYALAMLAWYLVEANSLPLDKNKVVKYALIHDWAEIYAGDVAFYASVEAKANKKNKEAESLAKLKTELEDWPEFSQFIDGYEKRADEESCFVYALDKLLPMINNYLDSGRTWKKDHLTLDEVISYKQDKVALSPQVKRWFDELVAILREKEGELFGDK